MRGQSAIEYLSGYLLTFVAISVLGISLWRFGFLSPRGEYIKIYPTNLELLGYRLEEGELSIEILNPQNDSILITGINVSIDSKSFYESFNKIVLPNYSGVFALKGYLCEEGKYYDIKVILSYRKNTSEGFSSLENLEEISFRAFCHKKSTNVLKKFRILNYNPYDIDEMVFEISNLPKENIVIKDEEGAEIPVCFLDGRGECVEENTGNAWIKVRRIPAGRILESKGKVYTRRGILIVPYSIKKPVFSISFWIYIRRYSEVPLFFQKGDLEIYVSGKGELYYRILNGRCGRYKEIRTGILLPKRKWVHLVFVSSEEGEEIYLNSIEVFKNYEKKDEFYCSDEIFIGGDGRKSVNAYIDEFSIYERSLTKEEIFELYKGKRLGKEEVLYTFDELNCRDYSGNGRDCKSDGAKFLEDGVLGISPGVKNITIYKTDKMKWYDPEDIFEMYFDFKKPGGWKFNCKDGKYGYSDGYLFVIDGSRRYTCEAYRKFRVNYPFLLEYKLRFEERSHHYPFETSVRTTRNEEAIWASTDRDFLTYLIEREKRYLSGGEPIRYHEKDEILRIYWVKDLGIHYIYYLEKSDPVPSLSTKGNLVKRFLELKISASSPRETGGIFVDNIKLGKWYQNVFLEEI